MDRDIRAWGRRIVSLVNSLAAVGFSLFFLLGSLSERTYESLPGRVWPGLTGAGILLLNLLSLLYLRSAPGGGSKGRVEQIEGGPIFSERGGVRVQVSLEALSQGLMLAGQGVRALSRLQIKIERPTRRKILITAGFQVAEASPLQELGRELHQALTHRFDEMIALDEDHSVEYAIVFEGYSGKASAPMATKDVPVLGSRKDRSESPPFTGPRYPVEPGEEA